ncbi:MAG: hypothetical protein ACHQ2Z_08760 [Elusimicrobiota bacterium]
MRTIKRNPVIEIISHRVNSLAALERLPPDRGAEFDVRSRGSRLILNHEPFSEGDSLEDFLACRAKSGRKGTLVFNPKEDGLENEMLALARRFEIADFFLLDLAAPTLIRLAFSGGIKDLSVRVSEHEPLAAALQFKSRVKWVWVDCFSGKPPDLELVKNLKEYFRVCVVSPELQGYPEETIRNFSGLIPVADAVCTDHPELWY